MRGIPYFPWYPIYIGMSFTAIWTVRTVSFPLSTVMAYTKKIQMVPVYDFTPYLFSVDNILSFGLLLILKI